MPTNNDLFIRTLLIYITTIVGGSFISGIILIISEDMGETFFGFFPLILIGIIFTGFICLPVLLFIYPILKHAYKISFNEIRILTSY